MSIRPFGDGRDFNHMIAGILENIRAMTAFLNPCPDSYKRLGKNKAPMYVSWSRENRSQLIRIPAAKGEYRRAELRSPDPAANPYLAFALMIYAATDGITNKLALCEPADVNFYTASADVLSAFEKLPGTIEEARAAALSSDFIKAHIPPDILGIYCGR